MPKVIIDGIEIDVECGTTIIQAAEKLGIEIPRFCYHGKLSTPSNCRMCLVEVEGAPRPVPSCSYPCCEGMVVHTNTETVKKARQGVMEFLLANHPLDCPICDQGGECDLQDEAIAYGYDRSRYKEEKREVSEKDLGVLVTTSMKRCIQCTRCIRFCEEVAGVRALGMYKRGEASEINNYLGEAISSELSGNLIDVCPVGALNNKPAAFTYRPWELKKTETIDVFDAVGSNITIHSRGNEVIKVTPRLNNEVNEIWISDKTRFAIDGLKSHRIDKPYIRDSKGVLVEASWEEAIAKIVDKAKDKKIGAVIGDMVDCETAYILKELVDEIECRQDGSIYDVVHSMSYRFNSSFEGVDKADLILLIGTNPRKEAAVLNSRIYKNWYGKKIEIGLLGEEVELQYEHEYLGDDVKALEKLLDTTNEFAKALSKAEYPMIILGAGCLRRKDGKHIQALINKITDKYSVIREDWNGYNMLHSQASRVGALKMGCVSDKPLSDILKMDVVYLLGADEIKISDIDSKSFVIYQGHHGDKLASHADVILPSAAYTEKSATYINTEGRAQRTKQVVKPLGEAKEGWVIVRDIIQALGKEASYNNISYLRDEMSELYVMFKNLGNFVPAKINKFGIEGEMLPEPLTSAIDNFYMTDPISRASATMVECTKVFKGDNDG